VECRWEITTFLVLFRRDAERGWQVDAPDAFQFSCCLLALFFISSGGGGSFGRFQGAKDEWKDTTHRLRSLTIGSDSEKKTGDLHSRSSKRHYRAERLGDSTQFLLGPEP
jgi:hypothetical protein